MVCFGDMFRYKLSLKVVAQTAMHSGNTHERQPNFRHRKKNKKKKTEKSSEAIL